ncbi:MAG TPA: rubrerythrin [Anaerolineaceae bacterium]|jgi:rubrerythrin|nr:rubrerythrin [Anaerolineaceae bacterium]
MSKAYDDLMTAFAGESRANRKYTAFAKQADAEGFPQVARLFRAAAEGEAVHAAAHFKAANEIKTTKENLEAAIEGEHYEVVEMYPPMIADAQEEKYAAATKSFTRAWNVEKVHEALYKAALDTLGTQTEVYDYWVCPHCGFVQAKNAPDKCPVCGHPGSDFFKVV